MSIREQLKKKVPLEINGLVDLAYNLWWSWNVDSRDLFRLLDPPLWHSSPHNPIFVLRNITEERLIKRANNKSFLERYQNVINQFKREMGENPDHLWWNQTHPAHSGKLIAYLSMEYGIHASLPIYSGGLGVLSGDHLKESSDLGVPIVAVGFLYQEGYFTQKISSARNGWQEEIYREYDFNDMPIEPVLDEETGKHLIIKINFKTEIDVLVAVWQVKVGRITLFLLDSNIEENVPWYRDLTDRLYGGNTELRLQQELILGFGAVRLFEKLGIKPSIYHLNEGHCSFSSIERIRQCMKKESLDFDQALHKIRNKTLFTTHTPVPAGHDVFPFWMIELYFKDIIEEIGSDVLFALGSYDFGQGAGHGFNMTCLGMRTSSMYNGVSQLHKTVTEKMFFPLFNELKKKYKENFYQLTHITNGTHVSSFVSGIIQELFQLVNEDWLKTHDDPLTWQNQMLDRYVITDYHIWEYHLRAKERMFNRLRERSRENLRQGSWDTTMIIVNGALLDPDVLTIGFARRFATYKRANLIFSDIQRLKRIVNDPYRPVQFIFSGKAHPADDSGKLLIQQIVNYAKNPELGYRIAFLENYDLVLAKMLLQGCDIWLNNPLRLNEASGTSGIKASMNFIPNFSILDGWWAEGFTGTNGWAINPENKQEPNREAQDWLDAKSFYDILENEIVPMYYDREPGAIPFKWVNVMRQALLTTLPKFSARRMVKDYANQLYVNLLEKEN
ncbi:alpha-glucan family phosphorylase [Candidatus Hodarchaeum mangrovi]